MCSSHCGRCRKIVVPPWRASAFQGRGRVVARSRARVGSLAIGRTKRTLLCCGQSIWVGGDANVNTSSKEAWTARVKKQKAEAPPSRGLSQQPPESSVRRALPEGPLRLSSGSGVAVSISRIDLRRATYKLHRAICADQLAQSHLHRVTYVDQAVQSHVRGPTCANQLKQTAICAESVAQSQLHGE